MFYGDKMSKRWEWTLALLLPTLYSMHVLQICILHTWRLLTLYPRAKIEASSRPSRSICISFYYENNIHLLIIFCFISFLIFLFVQVFFIFVYTLTDHNCYDGIYFFLIIQQMDLLWQDDLWIHGSLIMELDFSIFNLELVYQYKWL